MNLAAFQSRFRDWLVEGDDDTASVFGENASAGLAIYQNNYRAQLVNCLDVSYPVLRRFIGEEAFHAAAVTHIDAHPPRGWTLDHYGADFADTLRSLYPDNPDLDELAWIEWMLGDAFVAADSHPVIPNALAEMDWDTAILALSSSLRVRRVTTNADDVWFAQREEQEVMASELLPSPAGCVIWRQANTCRLRRIDSIETSALLSLSERPTFAALCDQLVHSLGEKSGIQRAGQLLANGLTLGWLNVTAPDASDGLT